MSGPSKKGPERQPRSPFKNTSKRTDSTATEAQRERILALLRTGPQTTESLRKVGIFQVSTRIFELRGLGHGIATERITLWDRDGFRHIGVARYHLESEACA